MTHNAQTIEGYHSGDSLRLVVDVVDAPDEGDPVDIRDAERIDYAIVGQKGPAGDAETHVHKTLADGITIIDGQAGQFRIDIEPSDTDALSGSYRHECQLTHANGTVATLFGGTINVTADAITPLDTQ